MRGATCCQLHLLTDEHAAEQAALVDALAEVPAMLPRLREAHEISMIEIRDAAHRGAELADDGTDDLLVSEALRTNELQTWFLSEHLVDTPPAEA